MKSFKKSILAAGLAMAVITTIGGATVYAANPPQSYVNLPFAGSYINAKSDIKYNTGNAYTSYGTYADTVTVSSTYRYCNTSTGQSGFKTNSRGGPKSASVDFEAPNGCKSVSISSSHKVARNWQTWTASTFDDKEA